MTVDQITQRLGINPSASRDAGDTQGGLREDASGQFTQWRA